MGNRDRVIDPRCNAALAVAQRVQQRVLDGVRAR